MAHSKTKSRSRYALPGASKDGRLASTSSRRRLGVETLEGRLMMAADFGDAPTPYPTTLAEDGPRHEEVAGPILGASRDTESDGAHSATANSDGADEDGVVFGTLRVGQQNATAAVTMTGGSGSFLNAWVDFDGDGNWGGAGEQIADGLPVTIGLNTITFDVPSSATAGTVFARFRLNSQASLGVTGAAANGEVEDYSVTIEEPSRASGQFNAGQDVGTSLASVQAAIALDVNSDGQMDLVSADYGNDAITWHRRNEAGTYSKFTISSTVNGAKSVFAADVNGDGKLDVISAAQLGNALYWHEYTGGTAFTTHTISTNVPKASTVVAADLDGDGDMDVISGGNNAVRWFQNNGNAVFTARVLPTAGVGLSSVTVANLDGDGDLDVLFASSTDNRIGWFENNGSETFTARTISTSAMGATSVAAADLDDDGDIDVLSASSADNKIAWYENQGAQGFTTRIISSTAMGAGSVTTGDIDGDGDLDVLAGSATDSKISWHQNDGNQNFVERFVATDALSVRTVAAADFDGDGDLDVFAAQAGNARVRRFENRSLGNYQVDSAVDGSDYLLWQRAFGQTPPFRGATADGDGSNMIDAGDLGLWRENFGWRSSASPGGGGGIGFGIAQPVSGINRGTVVSINAVLTDSLFAAQEPLDSTSMLLAEEESQRTATSEARDVAFAALPAGPRVRFEEIPAGSLNAEFDELGLTDELGLIHGELLGLSNP